MGSVSKVHMAHWQGEASLALGVSPGVVLKEVPLTPLDPGQRG